MKESVVHRHTCSDLNDQTVYYELYDDLPAFSQRGMGDRYSVVLRNKETRQLEEIEMRITGKRCWIGTRDIYKIWGEIIADDMDENYSTLHFEYDEKGDIENIYAVRDARGVSPDKTKELARKAKYAAEITAILDPRRE